MTNSLSRAGKPNEMYEAAFNSDILTIARDAAGLSQSELSEQTGISQNCISRWEAGLRIPGRDEVERLAAALSRPANYFYRAERPLTVDVAFMYHRARARTRQSVLRTLHAKINVVRLAIASMKKHLRPWEVHIVPSGADNFASAADVAKHVRAKWQVRRGPIHNLIELVEAAGAIVVPFDFDTPDVDAIGVSTWDAGPLFFVNSIAPADRMRFSLAHELGHLLMHEVPSETMENEANEFASEFLLPGESAAMELRELSSSNIWTLKRRWRMSGQSLVYRAREVGLIDESRYTSLMAYFSKRGWRKAEPHPIAGETATTLKKIVAMFLDDLAYSYEDLQTLTGFTLAEMDSILGMKPETPQLKVFDHRAKPR